MTHSSMASGLGWDEQFRPIPSLLDPFGSDGQPLLPITTQEFDYRKRRFVGAKDSRSDQVAAEAPGQFILRVQSGQMHYLHQERLEVLEPAFGYAIHDP